MDALALNFSCATCHMTEGHQTLGSSYAPHCAGQGGDTHSMILCTDGSSVLAAAVKQIGGSIARSMSLPAGVSLPASIRSRTSMPSTVSRLKNWIRRFHGVATKYLDSGWFRTHDRSVTTGLQPASLLALALGSRPVVK
jgi:hypothetical protein